MRKPSRFEEMRRRVPSPIRVETVAESELAECETVLLSPDDSVLLHPHQLEQEVRHRLMEESSLNFTSLVVRRVRDGLCLEGGARGGRFRRFRRREQTCQPSLWRDPGAQSPGRSQPARTAAQRMSRSWSTI